jgi:signal transduction histidine kinase
MPLSYSYFSFLADLTVLVHAIFVLFVVGGQILIVVGWLRKWIFTQNIIFRWLHLAAIGYVVLESWLGITCPLTLLENYLRFLAGETSYHQSFIGYWVHYFLFYTAPPWVFTLVYSIFGSLVLFTFIMYPPRRKN